MLPGPYYKLLIILVFEVTEISHMEGSQCSNVGSIFIKKYVLKKHVKVNSL